MFYIITTFCKNYFYCEIILEFKSFSKNEFGLKNFFPILPYKGILKRNVII